MVRDLFGFLNEYFGYFLGGGGRGRGIQKHQHVGFTTLTADRLKPLVVSYHVLPMFIRPILQGLGGQVRSQRQRVTVHHFTHISPASIGQSRDGSRESKGPKWVDSRPIDSTARHSKSLFPCLFLLFCLFFFFFLGGGGVGGGTKVGPDKLGPPVRVGSTWINLDRLGS